MRLETGDSQDLKYGVYRIIGSGATVQSVSRCLLVVKTAIPLFHMKLFVSSTKEERYLCGPRLLATIDTEGNTFRYIEDNLTDAQLEAADGSSALIIVRTIRLSVGPKPMQVCVTGEGVQGVLTLICGGVAQTCHDDRVVELKEQLRVEEVDGKDRKEK